MTLREGDDIYRGSNIRSWQNVLIGGLERRLLADRNIFKVYISPYLVFFVFYFISFFFLYFLCIFGMSYGAFIENLI